eukprot:18214_1
MTNSVLNNDSTQMQDDKWKKYKQRLPPTFGFIKHAISRLSEVVYRIGLLALFWTVCGGWSFGIMLAIDLVFIFVSVRFRDDFEFNADSVLLVVNSLIVIPSEEFYASGKEWAWFLGNFGRGADCNFIVCFLNGCCCLGAAVCCALCSVALKERCIIRDDIEVYTVPTFRIGVSITEFIVLIIWAFYGENGERTDFVFSWDYGLSIFIATCACFVIHSQYLILFPNFSLPCGVSARSKWGYAYSNEFSELVKVKVPTKKMPYKINKTSKVPYTVHDETSFWDEPYQYRNWIPLTACVLAWSNGQQGSVNFLEERGAVAHKDISQSIINSFQHKDLPKNSKLRLCNRDAYEKYEDRIPYTSTVRCVISFEITNAKEFWDEPIAYSENKEEKPITAAVYALAKENYDIVNWLENQGAEAHKGLTVEDAKKMLKINES